jgi:cell division septation protein DedD
VNSRDFHLSAAALAACFSLALSLAIPAAASLADHPEPARLDTSLPAVKAPAPVLKASAPVRPDSALVKTHSVAGREEILSLARKGLLDSAFAAAKSALAAAPGNPFLLLMMGKLSPNGKESAEYFRKAIKAGGAGPEAEESQFRLGQFHYAAGKYYLAIPCFRDYLKVFPAGDWKEPAAYWMGNACLSLAQGRPDKAAYLDSGAVWFQKLLDRTTADDYYYHLALEGLAKAKAAKGDRAGALSAARSALQMAPQEEQSPLLLLAAQLNQGMDRQEEKRLMARLVSAYPQSPEARYLRKLNGGADTSRWRSGSGLPRPAPAPAPDSLSALRAADSLKRAAEASVLPPARPSTPSSAPSSGPSSAAPGPRTAAPAAATGAEPAPAATGKGYTLQLGAFSQAANAQAMMANLAKAGLTPELVESNRGGKKIYQVRIGRFATSEAASEYARTTLKPLRFLSQPVPINP